MKRRKPGHIDIDPVTAHMLQQIDDALDALNRNEDELVKITNELMKRKMTLEEQETLKSNYKKYLESTQSLKGIL